MALPRIVHKVWAHALGFFWLPCPSCGRYYGGHEAKGDALITRYVTDARGLIVGSEGLMLCPYCEGDRALVTARPVVHCGG